MIYIYIYIYIYNQSDISITNVLRGSFDMSIVFWYNGKAEYALIVKFISYPLYLNQSYLTLIDHEMGRQAKLFIISRLLPGWFRDCGRGRFTILCDWCVLVPIQVFFVTNSFWEFHPTRRVPEGDRNPSMWTARVVSWEVPDQTGVLFLSLVGKFEKSERFARAKHVLHVYGNNLEKNEKTISSLWMGLVRHWRHSISRENSTDMVIVLVNVMVQNECGIFKSNIGQKRRYLRPYDIFQ